MAAPEAKPATLVVNGALVQTAGALLGVLFSVGVVLPVLVTVITVPIVTGAGFLLITANASGAKVGFASGVPVLVIDVDGVSVLGVRGLGGGAGGAGSDALAGTIRVAVAAGPHTVNLRMSQESAGGSFAIDPVTRPLQDSASLIVLEARS